MQKKDAENEAAKAKLYEITASNFGSKSGLTQNLGGHRYEENILILVGRMIENRERREKLWETLERMYAPDEPIKEYIRKTLELSDREEVITEKKADIPSVRFM